MVALNPTALAVSLILELRVGENVWDLDRAPFKRNAANQSAPPWCIAVTSKQIAPI